MNLDGDEFLKSVQRESEAQIETLQKIFSAADNARVFGQPVVTGEYTVITAAEVAGGGGLGSGMGFGRRPERPRGQDAATGESGDEAASPRVAGGGRGGGGGGGSMGRPVAAIVIGPEGVDIRPILDVSKVGLTAVAAFSGIVLFGLKILRKRL
jgi:uncharacterized spore protein YtfJ